MERLQALVIGLILLKNLQADGTQFDVRQLIVDILDLPLFVYYGTRHLPITDGAF